MLTSNTDTIVAIATPAGMGGVGVVRLSGPASRAILAQLWRGRMPVERFEPRKLYLGEIGAPSSEECSPNERSDREHDELRVTSYESRIDRVLAVHMPAPQTYTGQEVVELHAHGSPIVLRQIVDACVNFGARLAEPGEFTRRAFLAGKLDLAQAEAVADLIHADSERAVRAASEQLDGRLSLEVGVLHEALADARARVEAAIDFPEEEDVITHACHDAADRLASIAQRCGVLAATFREGRLVREGVRTAIVGPPNAGKSTLLNRLAGQDRAIVHHTPGTTRDVIEESVVISGIAFRLCDTAGLRDGASEIEGLGIDRTQAQIERADLIIAVIDGSRPMSSDEEILFASLDPTRTIVVQNKSDLSQPSDARIPGGDVAISAKLGTGIDELKRLMVNATEAGAATDGAMVTNARHKGALDEAHSCLTQAQRALDASEPIECIAQLLRRAQDVLGTITGSVTDDAILDRIFSQFCIGK